MTKTVATVPLKPEARVIVTAAGAGIGRVIAESFLANGARVHVCDLDENALDDFAGEHARLSYSVCDLAKAEDIDRMFDEAGKALGGLDILVNNAGVPGPVAPVWEIPVAEWRHTQAVNIDSHFLCVRRAVPMMRAARSGAIINISSVAGRLGVPLRAAYCASKWAVVGLTKSLATELGTFNIRVNAVLPGAVEGDRLNKVMEAKAKAYGISYELMHHQYLATTSMRRLVTGQDVANMVLFLASDASDEVSGQAISVCGNTEYMR